MSDDRIVEDRREKTPQEFLSEIIETIPASGISVKQLAVKLEVGQNILRKALHHLCHQRKLMNIKRSGVWNYYRRDLKIE